MIKPQENNLIKKKKKKEMDTVYVFICIFSEGKAQSVMSALVCESLAL